MMQRPVFFLACMVLTGAVAGRALALPGLVALGACATLLLLAAALGPRAMRPGGEAWRSAVGRALLGALFCLAFFQQTREVDRERRAESQIAHLSQNESVRLRATVATEPSRRGERIVLTLRDGLVQAMPSQDASDPSVSQDATCLPLECRVQLSLVGRSATLRDDALPAPGERIEIVTALRVPPEAIHSDLFDYRAFLRTAGIGALATVKQTDAIRRVPSEDDRLSTALLGGLMRWRRAALARIESAMPPGRSGVLKALLLGETGEIDPATRERFTRVGAAHLFAVSGLHTGLLALMVFVLCRMAFAPPRLAACVVLAVLAVYLALVGFRAPVVRASVLVFCMTLPFLARRSVDALNSLSLAAFLTTLVNPLAPWRSDFQFSYLCAFGLLTLGPTIRPALSARLDGRSSLMRRCLHFYNHYGASALAAVAATQLAVLPLLSVYYHQFSWIGFLANVLLVPVAFATLGVGWALVLVGSLIPGLSPLLGAIASCLTGAFIQLAEAFSAVPGAATALPALPWWLAGLYYAVLFTGPHMRMRRSPGASEARHWGLAWRTALALALLVWWPVAARLPFAPGAPNGRLELAMLDVGQGDSSLLILPNGRAILVDTGRRGQGRTVLEFLRSQGIDEIDALILTHTDADHVGAAAEILDGIYVARVLLGPSRSQTETQECLDAALERNHTPTAPLARGDRIRAAASVRLEVLSPPERSDASDTNDASLALLAEFGEMTILLTGDAGLQAERAMIAHYGAENLEAEVLKVGHHGSHASTGPAFADAVRPRVALISVGERNTYGHPAPEVVERLKRGGAQILSTAENGCVELRTNGQKLEIRAARGAQRP